MSDERQETIDDIVKEIRGNAEHNHALVEISKYLTEIADRIETAHRREREATRDKSSQVGNTAAMREALEKTQSVIATCMEILNKIPDGCDYDRLVDEVADELCDLRDSHVKAALSSPPRNCDVLSDTQEALAAIHEDRGYVNNPIDERRLTVEWLFAEAKGETDGSK